MNQNRRPLTKFSTLMFCKDDGVHVADWMTDSAGGMNKDPIGEDRQRRISTHNVPNEVFFGLTIGVASRNLLLLANARTERQLECGGLAAASASSRHDACKLFAPVTC